MSIHLECILCKNKIPFQQLDQDPICSDCGHSTNKSWLDILQKINLSSMMIDGNTRKELDGEIVLSIFLEKQEQFLCQHCKSSIELNPDVDLTACNCESCMRKLEFYEIPELKGLVFYDTRIKHQLEGTGKTSMIAFNCTNCGAPLKADSSRSSLFCSFCGTQNAITRTAKIPLSQMMVAQRKEKHPREMAFGNNGWMVTQSLKEHSSTFTAEDFNKILLNNKNELSVFHTIHKILGHTSSNEVLESLFSESTNREVIIQAGDKLGKSDGEMTEKLDSHSIVKKEDSEKKSGFFKKLFG